MTALSNPVSVMAGEGAVMSRNMSVSVSGPGKVHLVFRGETHVLNPYEAVALARALRAFAAIARADIEAPKKSKRARAQ